MIEKRRREPKLGRAGAVFRACGYVGSMAVVDAMARGNTRFSDIIIESGVIGDTGNRILKELVVVGLAEKNDAEYTLTARGLCLHALAMDIEEELCARS
jgi:predicted transcriptional regulator